MSRSKKDILETEAMLQRLTTLLIKHAPPGAPMDGYGGTARTDAESLRRISMTLHRWHELECNGDIERGEVSNKPYWVFEDENGHKRVSDCAAPDREAGARKRLAAILKRYPSLTAYVQTDPRGCALYILTKADVPAGATVDSCYSRGLAVFQ